MDLDKLAAELRDAWQRSEQIDYSDGMRAIMLSKEEIDAICELLRAIAGSDRAKKEQAVAIFEEAAKIIDETREIMQLLEDVPGDTPLDKVKRLRRGTPS